MPKKVSDEQSNVDVSKKAAPSKKGKEEPEELTPEEQERIKNENIEREK